jgi:D-alanyl-D-alanine carboxypeptidase/D-alanyl-D-alanine-endopeptidase (penicillin-binding protein 4)
MGVALQANGSAPRDLADASRLLANLVERSSSATPGADKPVLASGSGITIENRLSAADLVGLLRREYRDSRHFPVFYGSLVVPRDAPFAYLRTGNTDWLDRVALKTGSLSEPVAVSGLSGYMRKKNGGWMAFAVIVNGTKAQPSMDRDRSLRATRSDLEAILALY